MIFKEDEICEKLAFSSNFALDFAECNTDNQ